MLIRRRGRRSRSSRAGASYVEAVVLLAFIALGLIAGVRSLGAAVSQASADTAFAVEQFRPLELAGSPASTEAGAAPLTLPAASHATEPPQSPAAPGGNSEQAEPSLAERAWDYIRGEPQRAVDRGRQTAEFIGQLADGAKQKITESKQRKMDDHAAWADTVKDVPVLGPIAQVGKSVLNTRSGLEAGVAEQLVNMVADPLQAVASPVDTVKALPEMASHSPIIMPGVGFVANPLKVLDAETDEQRARAYNPLLSLRDDWDYHTKPFEEDYNNGDYAEIGGRVGTEVAAALIPFGKAKIKVPKGPGLPDPPAVPKPSGKGPGLPDPPAAAKPRSGGPGAAPPPAAKPGSGGVGATDPPGAAKPGPGGPDAPDPPAARKPGVPDSPRWTVDPSLRAVDEAAGLVPNGRYIVNPTAEKLTDTLTTAGKIGSKGNGTFMYVIDESGQIIVGSRSGQRMPHPTLIGGENPTVLGAGIVDIRGGRIYKVDNVSGHFKPGPGSIEAAEAAFNKFREQHPNAFHKDFTGYHPFTPP